MLSRVCVLAEHTLRGPRVGDEVTGHRDGGRAGGEQGLPHLPEEAQRLLSRGRLLQDAAVLGRAHRKDGRHFSASPY